MVKQGAIIKVNLDPKLGHEQNGYRPVLVISNEMYNSKTNLLIVLPITNTYRKFPLHISLDHRTQTTGEILCEQVVTIDHRARGYQFVEIIPDDLLEKAISYVYSEIDRI